MMLTHEMQKGSEGTYVQRDLEVQLELTTQSSCLIVYANNIERISLGLQSYGYSGSISFSSFGNDELDSLISANEAISFNLSINYANPIENEDPSVLEIGGCFKAIRFKKIRSEREPKKITFYEVDIGDAAQVTWSHHFPIEIYTDTSMQEVIEDHRPSSFNIDYAWQDLQAEQPIIAFALGTEGLGSRELGTSFYDFLNWYLYKSAGVLSYDYTDGAYQISGQKNDSQNPPVELVEWWVSSPVIKAANPNRHQLRTLNHSCNEVSEKLEELVDVYEKARRDLFFSDGERIFPEMVELQEKSLPHASMSEVAIEIAEFADGFRLSDLLPGSFIQLKGGKNGATWTDDPEFKGKTFRSYALEVEFVNRAVADGIEKPAQPYLFRASVFLEHQEEEFIRRPGFREPRYPFHIQGSVVSEIGSAEQSTYEIEQSVEGGQYLVDVPLVKSGDPVVVPFMPTILSGQYYFPLCKGEQVLLAMNLNTARFERIVDWQPHARKPEGVQANQIVFASNGREYFTLLRHEFEGGSESVLTLEQSSSMSQKRMLTLRDKKISLVLSNTSGKKVELLFDEDEGVSLSLNDKQTGQLQKTHFDGKSMTHTCTGEGGSSSIKQDPESVTIDCQTINMKAKNINLEAGDSITQKGTSSVEIQSQVATVQAGSVKLGS
jgi:hypothetical protein